LSAQIKIKPAVANMGRGTLATSVRAPKRKNQN
jgi:hypothetical protein